MKLHEVIINLREELLDAGLSQADYADALDFLGMLEEDDE